MVEEDEIKLTGYTNLSKGYKNPTNTQFTAESIHPSSAQRKSEI